MKNAFILVFVIFCISAKSQITLEHTFPAYNLETVSFTNTNLGEKYFTNTEQINFYYHPDTITIYNSDYSVYKTIPLPANYIYAEFYNSAGSSVPSLSDELFNSDTLLEFIAARATNSGNDLYIVLNEMGQTVFTFPDTINAVKILKMGTTFKMATNVYSNNSAIVEPYKVYSLPGSLPCSQCSSFTSGVEEPGNNGVKMGLAAYPNPFNNTLNINYNLAYQQDAKIVLTDILGQELINMPVSKQSDNLSINTSGFAKGVIVVTLYGSKGDPISKKLIKIE